MNLLVQSGEELGIDDMVNIRKPSINAVTEKKPKLLKGFNQNGITVKNVDLKLLIHGYVRLSANRRNLSHICFNKRNVVSQYSS